MGKITPGLRWIINGILIDCWQTLFQVLNSVNFYENVMLHVAWKKGRGRRGSSKLFNMTHQYHNLIHLQCLFLLSSVFE